MPTVEPDEIIRSRRKTLAITVDSFARVIVRAPLHCSEARIFAFLEEKKGWIAKQKEKMKGAGICLPPENLDGYTFLLLGKTHVIRLTDEKCVRYDEELCVVYLPETNAHETLVAWLKKNAKRILTELTAQTATLMGVQYQYIARQFRQKSLGFVLERERHSLLLSAALRAEGRHRIRGRARAGAYQTQKSFFGVLGGSGDVRSRLEGETGVAERTGRPYGSVLRRKSARAAKPNCTSFHELR